MARMALPRTGAAFHATAYGLSGHQGQSATADARKTTEHCSLC